MTKVYTKPDCLRKGLSIRWWTINDIQLVFARIRHLLALQCAKIRLSKSKSKSKSDYIRLSPSPYCELSTLLHQVGFFSFLSTNKGFIYCEHQVVLYLKSGYRKYINGEFCVVFVKPQFKGDDTYERILECHHIDGNVTNNHLDNLVYVSPYENKLLAAAVKGGFYLGKAVSQYLANSSFMFKHILRQTRAASLNYFATLSFT